MDETKILVRYTQGMSHQRLSPEAVEMAKLCLLDTVGVGLFAASTPWASIVAEMAAEAECTGESTVWGRRLKATTPLAALVNGTAAHGIEMDDRKHELDVHTGSMTIPATLAAAEKARTDGKGLITAIVMGYEVAYRVARATPGQLPRGIHAPGHKGIWGAVAGASKALGLDQDQMINAFGIAGSMASGIWEFTQDPERTMVKRLHGGWAAHNGAMAAILGQKGLTAPSTVLEGKYGYCRVYEGVFGAHPEELAKDLGRPFEILGREVKPYSAWGGSHMVIDAVGQFKERYQASPEEVEKISIGASTKLISQHEERRPRSLMAAQYSLPFITALSFFKDLRDPGVWTEEVLSDPAVLRLDDKVEWHVDEEQERVFHNTHGYAGVRVTIKLKDGREFRTRVDDSKGTTGNPMTPQEIRDKFRLLAGKVLPARRVEDIARMVDSLEQVKDVRRLGELLLAP